MKEYLDTHCRYEHGFDLCEVPTYFGSCSDIMKLRPTKV